jgi:pyruvate-ferredoxin/flavodoxin oxidoreductase
VLKKANPEAAARLMVEANKLTATRYDLYKKLAEMQADCGAKK